MDVRFKSITSTRIQGIGILQLLFFLIILHLCCRKLMLLAILVSAALSYQALTNIGYSATILNQVSCCLLYKLWILFVLTVFPDDHYYLNI